jgi:molybdopterin converting factor subunit 1
LGQRWYTHGMHAVPVAAIGVTVRFFASLRELTGEHEIHLEVPATSRPADVWEACVQRWPALASRRQSTVLAVNREFARGDIVIQDGDEVALLPPVSGGAGNKQHGPIA